MLDMRTVRHRPRSLLHGNKVSERDVTVKLTDEDGTERMLNGFFVEIGSLVTGFSLDPDPEYELEYTRPEIKLTLINAAGIPMKAIEAWENTPKGPRTVFKKTFEEVQKAFSSDPMILTGPAY